MSRVIRLPRSFGRGWLLTIALLAVVIVEFQAMRGSTPASGQEAEPPPVPPPSLKTVPVPGPANIGEFVVNTKEAIKLGKALFWDMQLGSDGVTACATCHFAAGADGRTRNEVSPGLLAGDTTFQTGGPNYHLTAADFPLHKVSDPADENTVVSG